MSFRSVVVLAIAKVWSLMRPALVVAIGMVVATAAVDSAKPANAQGLFSTSARFLLTVQLQYEGRDYTASAVWELRAHWGGLLIRDPNGPTLDVGGEAIDIPLAGGRTLFVLRRGDIDPPSSSFGGQYLVCVPGITAEDRAANLPTFKGPCSPRLYPRIVVADQNGFLQAVPYDPKTLAGPSVRILSISAGATSADLGSLIIDRHPWIRSLPSGEAMGFAAKNYIEDFSRR
jgi:hypothetical protein